MMHPTTFIHRQVSTLLKGDGYSDYVVNKASDEAVNFYQRSTGFKKGVFNECFTRARMQAKQMKRAGM